MLQRLARDGLADYSTRKANEGKQFRETSGLNILETVARLDHDRVPQLVDNLLAVRTNISAIFIRTAFRNSPENVLKF